MSIIYLFDLIGTFAFAVYGAYVGIKKDFDIIGVFLCAFACSVGGGTIREFILGNIPFYFFDNNYIFMILGGILFAIITYRISSRINTFMLVVDAIGLATFAYIGAEKAVQAGLGIFGIMFLSSLSAAGGSIIRDILVRELPHTLRTDLYITPTLIASFLYALLGDYRDLTLVTVLFLAGVFCARLYAIFHKVQLWRPRHSSIHGKLWEERKLQVAPSSQDRRPHETSEQDPASTAFRSNVEERWLEKKNNVVGGR